jgi:hypothetical protein
MRRPKKSKKERQKENKVDYAEEPEYPWGLEINLEDDSLNSLDLKADNFKVGNEVSIMARARVDRISSNKSRNGRNRDAVGLQITDMGFEGQEEKPPSKFEAHQKIVNSEGGVIED